MTTTNLRTIQVVDSYDPSNVITAEVYVPVNVNSHEKTIILLPFWGGTAETYAKVQHGLIQRCPNNPSIAISYRGFGKALNKDKDIDWKKHSVNQLSAELLKFLRSEAIAPLANLSQLIICGHSIAAKIALSSYMKGADAGVKVSSLLLIGPAPPQPLRLSEEERNTRINAYNTLESARWATNNVLTHRKLDEDTITQLTQGMVSMSDGARKGWMEVAARESLTDSIKAFREENPNHLCPVRVIVGDHDQVDPAELVKEETVGFLKGEGFDVHYTVVEDCGHLIPLERPEVLVNALHELIQ